MRFTAMAACAALIAAAPAAARLTQIEVKAVEPFAPGTSFGNAGAYERVKGVFRGELDPQDRRNRVIANLDKAPRNAAGKVEYEADFFMLRPADATRGNGKIIYDVTNRGRLNFHWRFTESRKRTNDPRVAEDAGDAAFFRDGYTFVWSGWDPDAPTRGNGLAMKPVVATDGAAPIVRTIREEFVSGTRARDDAASKAKGTAFRLTYEAASLDQSRAKLTVRRTNAAPRREIPASGWAFVSERSIRLIPDGTQAEPGSLYEFHYEAKNPRVLGVGMAATRDLVSFLRYEPSDAAGTPNPAGTAIRRALAFGSSQSGRFLRDYVRDGFNQDERARKVFDGVMAHTAGVGGVFLNEAFAQPNRTSTQHEDHSFPEAAFPFSTARLTDPVTGKTGALFRDDGFDPLWMETNTSTEYWQKGASLLTTDPLGKRDIALPPNARSYLIAGTQHNATAWMASTRGSCVNARNPHNPVPLQRALMAALDEWVDGKAPPASRVPRIADGTLVPSDALKVPAIPGVQVARRMHDVVLIRDWIKPDIDESARYRALVPHIDTDGNERAGVLLPDIAVPLATHTGWNLFRAPFAEGELCDRDGTHAPFARTRAEREANGDARLSLEERYGSHARYVERYEAAVRKLVAERLLLPEDGTRLVAKVRSTEIAKRFEAPVVEQAGIK
ncbi:MAG TPA: alpha/beta hydrolase domain-containing protein [Burkholderiales bacterium]|nr:alpha/beta hydrolase domain-containing protein [Burkholderiales bacterium]